MIKISRSGVEAYINCKRCFILQYKHKVKPRSLPFALNLAIDNLCKNEFDHYREIQEPHPIFIEHGIDAVPFKHSDMNKWRNNFQGIRYKDEQNGFDFGGAVVDVWIKSDGNLIISDAKATSRGVFNWEETWEKYEYPKGYKRQLEMYQWLFRKNGFSVTNEAYLLYYNGLRNEPMFDQALKFEHHLIKLDCDDSWVEEMVIEAVNLLLSDTFPEASSNCENCTYLKKRWNVTQDSPFNS